MKQKIQITIPEPCHEGWQNMTPVEKGRFCASCQKTVLDFTYLSDNEIINLVSKNDNLCIRVKETQLNRNLIGTKRTSNYFGYFATSVLAFLGLGTERSIAQEKPVIEQTDLKYLNKATDSVGRFSINGKVFLENKALAHVTIIIKGTTLGTQSDENGRYSILVTNGDVLVFSYLGLENVERNIRSNNLVDIHMNKSNSNDVNMEMITMGYGIKKRTFFGRTFREIGNWFR